MTDKEKAEGYYEDNDYYSSLSEIEDYDEIFGLVEGIAEIGDYDDWELAE